MNRVDVRDPKNSLRGCFRAARHRLTARNDAGISMIELLVAVTIIIVVLLSGTAAIDFALTDSNTQRLNVEATNLAVAQEEQAQQLAATLGIGQTTKTITINTTTFTIVTNVSDLDQNGATLVTVCTSSGTSISQQIWQVTVTVTWPKMNGAQPITQSTEVSPGQDNALDLSNGEIAVSVTGTNFLPLTTPMNFTVTPNYISNPSSPPAYPTPTGETDPAGATFNTGNDGCGVVTGLSTSPLWNYIVTLTGNPGWVSSSELSDSNVVGGVTQDPTETLTTLPGQVTRVNPAFQMAQGITTTFTLTPVDFTCAGGNPNGATGSGPPSPAGCNPAAGPPPVATLPVTVGNSSLANSQYTFGNDSTAITSELLYPYGQYDVWSGDMSQSNPGATVTGLGSFLYPGAGSTDDSPTPVVLTFGGSGTTAIVSVPTYDLAIKITSACSTPGLDATEQAGSSIIYPLNAATGGVSSSGMPLGEYKLTSACSTFSVSGGAYIWITPTGLYQSTTAVASPVYANHVAANQVQVTE
ncbi:MAG: hypothetical protein ABSE47_06300 [Acidimicrobiales bacterium]